MPETRRSSARSARVRSTAYAGREECRRSSGCGGRPPQRCTPKSAATAPSRNAAASCAGRGHAVASTGGAGVTGQSLRRGRATVRYRNTAKGSGRTGKSGFLAERRPPVGGEQDNQRPNRKRDGEVQAAA